MRRRFPRVTRTLEHKLYFDEAYDLVFYRPTSGFAGWLMRRIEEPLILAPSAASGSASATSPTAVAAAQTGRVRVYVLALAVGLAVLAVVFLIVA